MKLKYEILLYLFTGAQLANVTWSIQFKWVWQFWRIEHKLRHPVLKSTLHTQSGEALCIWNSNKEELLDYFPSN